jgi:hypothetical protein
MGHAMILDLVELTTINLLSIRQNSKTPSQNVPQDAQHAGQDEGRAEQPPQASEEPGPAVTNCWYIYRLVVLAVAGV